MADNWNDLVYYYLAAATCLLYLNPCQSIVIEGPSNVTYLPGLTTLPIKLTCTVNGVYIVAWEVNGRTYRLAELDDGELSGHSRNGSNMLVNRPVNNTKYICVSQANDDTDFSDPSYIIIAGVPLMVPSVMIDFTLTLSWGEPFSNFDPIVNYTVTVVWNNGTFLQTTDSTTKNCTIPNLIPLTAYTFYVVATNSIGSGPAGVVMNTTPSGYPNKISAVKISEDSVKINGSNVTLTLSWGEPLSYFSPIISYTVSWNDGTLLQNFTTTDDTTRSYTITNLTPMTNYTFSVVATNSFGRGEAGILVDTTPGISQVNGIELQCSLVTLINQCTVTWRWNSLQETVTNFLIASNVGRFNVSSQSTSHTFHALSLPDGAQSGEVTVKVIAVNKLGHGPSSEVVRTNIIVPSVINAAPMLECTPAVSELYNITVTCNIHPDSIVDQCVVMAMADDGDTKAGNASVTEGIAAVVMNNLQCGVTYNIKAEGILNETLVGSRLSHGIINPGPCPMTSIDKESDDEFSTVAAVTISIAVTLIITLVVTALISVLFTSLYYKHLIIKSLTNQKIDSHSLTEDIKRHNPTTVSTSITMDTNAAYGNTNTIKMDPNPAYGNTATIEMNSNPAYGTTTTIKMDTNPAYATTSH